MIATTVRIVAAALALGVAGTPVISPAVEESKATTYYNTQFVQVYGSPAPYAGSLQLRISPDNIVNGYYRGEGGLGAFIPVTGGRDGDNIWFDIGDNARVHVTAKLVNGSIVGTAVARDVPADSSDSSVGNAITPDVRRDSIVGTAIVQGMPYTFTAKQVHSGSVY